LAPRTLESFIPDAGRKQFDLGEHSETFTVDGYWADIKEIIIKHIKGFGYKLAKEEGKFLVFEKGSLRKNLFTFSFDSAYKQVVVSIVGEEDAPVTTVSIYFSLPFLKVTREDLTTIRSFIRALRDFIIVTVGYSGTRARMKR
jgi:VCBS repeat-containing protein